MSAVSRAGVQLLVWRLAPGALACVPGAPISDTLWPGLGLGSDPPTAHLGKWPVALWPLENASSRHVRKHSVETKSP